MTDFLLLKQLHKMVKDIRRPRLIFDKGICVRGYFRPYMSLSDYTKAKIFDNITEITPVKARFSSMLGDCGTADTIRNIKGFSVKFCTGEKDFDLITHNLPVFFINDPEKILSLRNALTKNNSFDGINDTRFWQFAVDNTESINCIMHLFSNEGISDSFINIYWYSANTYIWKNKNEDKYLVRLKWKPICGDDKKCAGVNAGKKMNRVFAEFMAGFDPDIAMDGIRESISDGNFPAFELQAQILDFKYSSHPDYIRHTLWWNENINVPLSVGLLKITDAENREEEDSYDFAPGNTIDGIELCSDNFSEVADYLCRISSAERGGAK